MPIRHCVFVCDLGEMEKNFNLPLSTYVAEFLERPSPGDRLRDYAELAFANAQQIENIRRQDRQTVIMSRKLQAQAGPLAELPFHTSDATAEYVRTRTVSQFKWLLHAFAASGRMWIRELVCSATREWIEEILNLLFVQRGFVPVDAQSEEHLDQFRVCREAVLKLTGPIPVKEAGHEASDPQIVADDEFPWCPKQDGATHFRMIPGNDIELVARTLTALDVSPQAFEATGRGTPPRLQDITRTNIGRFRELLKLPYAGPAVLAFIGQ